MPLHTKLIELTYELHDLVLLELTEDVTNRIKKCHIQIRALMEALEPA